ncbi:hypothetical protein [Microbacterium plantarum]|uniref:hypothetical protein n=1 Tax=Microbacterium plantarum TaxID=1816425 RepID=UPI002B484FE7|nr:hypothetical protein [Microbacterium plantarum]WRK16111.1 hypothetical protein VC184_09275 [Microbacterium plantarum]
MDDIQAIRALVAGKSRVTPYVGRYVGNDSIHALVDMGGERLTMPFVSALVPEINEPVHVWSIDGAMFMVGPSTPKPGMGVVKTTSGDFVTVGTDFGDFVMPYGPPGEPPTSGDTVAINWSTSPSCIKLSTSPDPVEPPPAPGGGQAREQTVEIRASEAGSIAKTGANGWWQARPWNSPSNYGVWFYPRIADLIPADAEFVSLEIFLTWAVRRYDNTLRWGTHTSPSKGAGLPAVNGSAPWDPGRGAGWFTPPWAQDWFNAAKAGTFGVALNAQGVGREEAKSLAEDGQSGALRITYRR